MWEGCRPFRLFRVTSRYLLMYLLLPRTRRIFFFDWFYKCALNLQNCCPSLPPKWNISRPSNAHTSCLPFPFSSISFPLPHFTFVSYCSFPSYSLILHFAAAISPKYCLSCINHWPILAPIPDLPALIEEECGGVGRQTECRGLMLLQQPQEEGEPSSAY